MARPSMSSTVSPASAMAANTASRVSWKPDRSTCRPMADWPTPEMTTRRSNRSMLISRRHEPRNGIAAGTIFETDVDFETDSHVVGIAIPEAADDPDAGVVGELDQRDDIR